MNFIKFYGLVDKNLDTILSLLSIPLFFGGIIFIYGIVRYFIYKKKNHETPNVRAIMLTGLLLMIASAALLAGAIFVDKKFIPKPSKIITPLHGDFGGWHP